MAKRVNRGPEIFDPHNVHSEYSRQEWLEALPSAARRRRNRKNQPKYSLRILMLDILLLCIIGGVIFPFVIKRNSRGSLGEIRCSLTPRYSREYVFITLEMRNSPKGQAPEPVEIQISGSGRVIAQLRDLSPLPGKSRTWHTKIPRPEKNLAIYAIIKRGSDSLKLNIRVSGQTSR